MNTSDRNKIPEKYRWRMTDIYESDAAWETALGEVQDKARELADYRGMLGKSRESLVGGLRLADDMSRQLEQVYLYAKMYQDLNNADPARQAMQDRALGVVFDIQESTAFITPELSEVEPDTLRSWVSDVPEYVHMADNIIRSREHVLSAREEQLMAMAAPAIESIDSAFSMLESVDMKLGEITDESGQSVPLTHGLFGKLRDCRDRGVRAEAFAVMHGAFADMGNTIAALYSGSVRADLFRAKARGYRDCLDNALFSDNLPRSVYTELISAVRSRLGTNHRYLELRRKCLNVEKLHIYDTYVPIVDMPNSEYSYEQACEMVCRNLTPLGEEYSKDLNRLLAGGWVDVYETAGKTTGAYATGIYGVHPFMLLNFVGQLGDVFTLAHEAGHCLHTWYSDTQAYSNKDYPIFLAEIASTVNENILMRRLIAECDAATPDGKRKKAYLVNRFLEEIKGTVFRQTMFAEFELKTHEMAENGQPLTAESLCDLYEGLLRDYFGADVEIDDYMRWEWARIPHFYNAFYVFQYATGFSAAAAISRQILGGGEVEPYLQFLRAGGSDYPADTLRRTGVDLTTPVPVNDALDEFDALVDELETLMR